MKPYRKLRKPKAIKNQQTFFGEIVDYDLKYVPHRSTSKTGESVVVLRLPKEATQLERVHSHSEAEKLARGLRTSYTKDFWRKKPRDEEVRRMIYESSESYTQEA